MKNRLTDRLKALKVSQEKSKLKRLAALAAIAGTSSAFANSNASQVAADNSFDDLIAVLVTWLQGNLGKVIALFGFLGTFIVYAMTHRGSTLFIGIIISIIAGGLVGIVFTFFNIGQGAFQVHNPQGQP